MKRSRTLQVLSGVVLVVLTATMTVACGGELAPSPTPTPPPATTSPASTPEPTPTPPTPTPDPPTRTPQPPTPTPIPPTSTSLPPTPSPIPSTPAPTPVPPTVTPEGRVYDNAAVDALIPNYQLNPPRDPVARQGMGADGVGSPVGRLASLYFEGVGRRLELNARIVEIRGGYVETNSSGQLRGYWEIVIARAEDGAGNPTQTQLVRLNLNSSQTKLWRRQRLPTVAEGCRGPECAPRVVNDSVINHRLLQPGDFLELVVRPGTEEVASSGQGLFWVSEVVIIG